MNKTERESLEAQLEQNATDTRILLAGAEKERVRLEDLLAEPEMRHGDYGVYMYGYWLYIRREGTYEYKDREHNNKKSHGDRRRNRLGNIFDDMKRNSEDLEEFKTFGRGSQGIGFQYSSDCGTLVSLDANHGKNKLWFDLDGIEDIHQKLGQLIATQKRRK